MLEFNSMDKLEGSKLSQAYLDQINKEQQRILGNILPDVRPEKERSITDTLQNLSGKLSAHEGFDFGERQQAILKLKLTRYLETEEAIDTNTLFDAIIETPNFINKDRGSLQRLFEVHEEKTLIKIAEVRKKLAERKAGEGTNPWENLFTTSSGNYYMARLLNMPHLEMESAYMDHCVGTSNSYVNRMKNGEIEILSFRHVPKINSRTQKLEGDIPIITIEYNLKTNTIEQMKKANDKYLKPDDPYFNEVIDALKQLRITKTDTGKLRAFTKINPSELENIKVDDYYVLTENGAIPFREFDPDIDGFVFKVGDIKITSEHLPVDVAKIVRIQIGTSYEPDEIAQHEGEITNKTKLYLGALPDDFINLLDNIRIYTNFPKGEVLQNIVKITEDQTLDELQKQLDKQGIQKIGYAKDMIASSDFKRTLGKSPGVYKVFRIKCGSFMKEGKDIWEVKK